MTSSICVDASFVIRALGGHPLSETAIDLLQKWQKQRISLIAPTHLGFEVTSTLRRLVYLQALTPSQGEKAFAQFMSLPIRLSGSRKLFLLAWKLAKTFNRSRAYDTAYLALAQLRACEFWTADKRIYNAVKDSLDWVKCLSEGENEGEYYQ